MHGSRGGRRQTESQMASSLPHCSPQVCLELGQTWMESGVSEDAVSGHIQVGGGIPLPWPCQLAALRVPCGPVASHALV